MRQIIRMPLSVTALSLLLSVMTGITPAYSAIEMHMVPVLAQPVGRGEIILDGAVVLQQMKRSPAGIDYITSSEVLIGMAAKRPLRAGVPLRSSDITQPKLVSKGDLVTIAFEAPGLSLSVRGKALDDGARGQAIRVVNTQTSRTFEGIVAATGYVLVPPFVSHAPAGAQTSQLEYSATSPATPEQ
ncbi:MAG: flagellar basal body P-ring formation chaperone FlgA [Alphaproteobacteria bacterium]